MGGRGRGVTGRRRRRGRRCRIARCGGPIDWEFAKTAMQIAGYVHDGETKLAAELWAWGKVMGTTMDARISQRIKYAERPAGNEDGAVADVARMVDYRNL
jgi:hypothetical protein